MTVSSTNRKIQYEATGSLATFAYPFIIFDASHLYVTLYDGLVETEVTSFTATGVGDQGGGNVVFDSAPGNGVIVTIKRVVPITQETDYVENSPFQAETHEDALDKLTMIDQQLDEEVSRAIKFPNTDSTLLDPTLPDAETRATHILGFDADGEPTLSDSTLEALDGVIAAAREDGTLITSNTFEGDGVTTLYAIDAKPINRNALIVQVGGVVQEPSTYSVSGSVVTLSESAPIGVPITIRSIGYQKGGLQLEKTKYLSKYDSIYEALSTIGATQSTLVIDEAFILTSNTTIPSNVTLQWNAGCYVSGSYTLTINGGLIAGAYKLFDVVVDGSVKAAYILPQWFGAVGDGSTDDTTALQACFDLAAVSDVMVYMPAGTYKTSSALTYAGSGGIYMVDTGYGGATSNSILPTGSGYTALTVSGKPDYLKLSMYGAGNTINALLIQNPQRIKNVDIRVYNFDGFGVKINKCWDCLFNVISVENCGNTSEYAFSMNNDGDTCNMSHITRLQVEGANAQAIYIDPLTLSCVIDNIHSERAIAASGYTTWQLGGNQSQYNSARLSATAATQSDATCVLNGALCTYIGLRAESGIEVSMSSYSNTPSTLMSPYVLGTFKAADAQNGRLNIIGGRIETFDSYGNNLHFYGTRIVNAIIGFTSATDPLSCTFDTCYIEDLDSGNNTAACTLINTAVSEGNFLMQGKCVAINSIIICSGLLEIEYRSLVMDNSKIVGNVYTNNAYNVEFKNGSFIQGDLSSTSANAVIFDASSYCTGTVTGFAGIDSPGTGSWKVGQRTYNIKPSSGNPKSWVCTVAGTPGTWVSEGNL